MRRSCLLARAVYAVVGARCSFLIKTVVDRAVCVDGERRCRRKCGIKQAKMRSQVCSESRRQAESTRLADFCSLNPQRGYLAEA